jgi:hypothetical protein
LHIFHRHQTAISAHPFQRAVNLSANTLSPEIGSRMRKNSAKKDTALFAHQSSRLDRFGRLPRHDEIGFRLVLKALKSRIIA